MPKKIVNAKIACLDFSLQKTKMKLGVQVLVNDPENLEKIRARELDITREKIQKILATGVNVVLCSGGIDDICLKYFVEAKAMAVRRVKKGDLKRIAKATGAAYLTSLTNMEGEESFEPSMVGEAAEVSQEWISDDELILVKGPKARTASSIILRGPNDFYLDEMERSIHDALCVVKRVLEGKKVVAGGGCVEAALSIYLENFATSLSSREQLAIAEFAKSLLVIPKTLAVNAAKDATDLVAKLRAYHNSSQTKLDHAHLKWYGLDLIEGVVRDNKKAGVLEPAMSKIKSLKFATEAALTILRIDDMIKLNPEEKGGKSYADACAAGIFPMDGKMTDLVESGASEAEKSVNGEESVKDGEQDWKGLCQKLEQDLQKRNTENEILKARIGMMEKEQTSELKPTRTQEQKDDYLTKAKELLFEKTKICKRQEQQIEALKVQIESVKEVLAVSKEMLEVRNMENSHFQEQFTVLETRLKSRKGAPCHHPEEAHHLQKDVR
uniref:T-complex protein 1 subunit alpha n=1 Tax=Phlebotomus papatasi TaxID=29031 RepID=A0A1B0DG69_PHLPP